MRKIISGSPLLFVFICSSILMAIIEFLKKISFNGNLSMWESHLITIFLSASLTTIASYFFLKWSKEVNEQLKIAAKTFESQLGIMVTDSNSNILRVNSTFNTITGYTTQEVVGETPCILSSGRHDKAFYEEMWDSINQTGAWDGEIWNRRKSGEIYPQHLTITAVKNVDGILTNYVGIFADISKSKAASDEIKSLAFYDPLTRLPNRRLMMDRLQQALAACARSGRYGAIIFMDLDNFKPLNDAHGHAVGDLLLIEVGRRISKCIREKDTIARIGGDEFVVILSELNEDIAISKTQASNVGEKLRVALAEPYIFNIKQDEQLDKVVEHRCTVSGGIAMFLDNEAGYEEILNQADASMYDAKKAGRNQIRFHEVSN